MPLSTKKSPSAQTSRSAQVQVTLTDGDQTQSGVSPLTPCQHCIAHPGPTESMLLQSRTLTLDPHPRPGPPPPHPGLGIMTHGQGPGT